MICYKLGLVKIFIEKKKIIERLFIHISNEYPLYVDYLKFDHKLMHKDGPYDIISISGRTSLHQRVFYHIAKKIVLS